MNTKPKGVELRECRICGTLYGLAAGMPFQIDQQQRVSLKTVDKGTCPRHKKGTAE
jgi:hypothetical protein